MNWADGDTDDKSITVSIIDDSAAEADETIEIGLSNPQGGASLGTSAELTLSIIDDDTNGAALFAMSELTYAGAFRLKNGTFGTSSTNYAVGTLAYNPANHSLFIAGHAQQNAIAEYPIVPSGMQITVSELPETGNPLQDFVYPLGVEGNPEGLNKITGMLWAEGSLIVNAEEWYDTPGNNKDTTLVIADANNLAGNRDGYFELTGAANSGGYMGPIPTACQPYFGAEYFTGWSSVYSITSRYSRGPSLWTFDVMDILTGSASSNPQVNATAFMNYHFSGPHLNDPLPEAADQETVSAIWNSLTGARYGSLYQALEPLQSLARPVASPRTSATKSCKATATRAVVTALTNLMTTTTTTGYLILMKSWRPKMFQTPAPTIMGSGRSPSMMTARTRLSALPWIRRPVSSTSL